LHYTASGIITPVGGRLVHRLREDSVLPTHTHFETLAQEVIIISASPGKNIAFIFTWISKQSSLDPCTRRPPTGVTIPEAV